VLPLYQGIIKACLARKLLGRLWYEIWTNEILLGSNFTVLVKCFGGKRFGASQELGPQNRCRVQELQNSRVSQLESNNPQEASLTR
jgi:hypothetical protein